MFFCHLLSLEVYIASRLRGQNYLNIALVLQDRSLTIFNHPANTCTCPLKGLAPDKAAYCVFTQFLGPENAIKFISVRTKTQ